MKKVTAILLAFKLLCSINTYSQTNDIKTHDSLLAIINKTIIDKNSVDASYELAWYYGNRTKYDSAKIFIDKGFAFATSLKDPKRAAKAHHLYALLFTYTNRFDSAKLYSSKAEKMFLALNDTTSLLNCYNSQAMISNSQSDYNSAIIVLLKAEELLKNTKNPAYRMQQAVNYLNMGLNLAAENQMETAIVYQKKGATILSVLEETDNINRFKVLNYGYIAENLIKLNKYTEARLYLDSAITKFPVVPNSDVQSLILNIEANYYQVVKEPKKALTIYLKAFNLIDSVRNEKIKGEIAGNIASLYLEEKNYSNAEKFASIAITSGLKLRLLKVTAKGYEVLKSIAISNNDYKKAFRYAELYKLYADSATNSETQKTALTLEGKYQNEKKESEIATLTLSNTEKELAVVRRNRLLMIGGLTATALLLLTSLLYRSSRQKQIIAQNEQKLQQEQIKFLERQQQVISLQSMVNGQETERTRIAKDLHDGLGGLFSTVKMYFSTLKHEQEVLNQNELFGKSYELIDTASEEVRRIAHNMMPEVLMKLGLIPALQDMCSNISAGKLLQVKLQSYGMDERMNASTEIMLYRIIQELLNNIIKHAKATEVIVQFNREGNRLAITVEDNGRGFNLLEASQKNNAGLETIKSRVTYLNGNISIDSQQEVGTTVMMDFLLNEEVLHKT